MFQKAPKLSVDEVCMKVLIFIIQDEELLTLFVQSSGISPDQLKDSLDSHETMGYLMDFLLQEEEKLTEFCAEHNFSPESIWKIRHKLPGAPVPWN